jgi:hypothetical protein
MTPPYIVAVLDGIEAHWAEAELELIDVLLADPWPRPDDDDLDAGEECPR